jgi:hypothetical protein
MKAPYYNKWQRSFIHSKTAIGDWMTLKLRFLQLIKTIENEIKNR